MRRIRHLLCALSLLTSCASRHQVNQQCAFDDECDSALVCFALYCRAPCVTDRDCVGGYRCLPASAPGLRVCLPPAQNARCVYDTDCSGGLVCLPRGVCGRECLADVDCQARNPLTRCELPAGRCILSRDASVPDARDATFDTATDAPSDGATDAPSDLASDLPITMRDASTDSGSGPAPSTARALYPPIAAILTGIPSEFQWIEPAGSAGMFSAIEIQICSDPDCLLVEQRLSPPPLNTATTTNVTGRVSLASRLTGRTHYWRLRTTEGGAVRRFTPTWRFTARRGMAAIHGLFLAQGRTHDFNLDGYSDALLGAPAQQTVRVVFGEPTWVIPRSAAVTATELGLGSAANFGARLRFAGDTNNDGRDDVLAAGDAERVTAIRAVASGATAALEGCCSAVHGGATTGTGFGASFAGVGDLNGDGYEDLAIGMPSDPMDPGYRVYLGPLSGSGTIVSAGQYGGVGRGFGSVIVPVGDMNGDGHADFLVGSNGGGKVPVAFVPGVGGGADFPWTATAHPAEASGRYGFALAGAGDFNGDGYPDAAVGDPGATGATGRVFLLAGSVEGPVVSTPLPTPTGAPADFGTAVTGAGDLNDDGYADIVASNASGSFLAVYFGAQTPARPSVLSVTGAFVTGAVALGTGDDFNNDGRAELLIGNSMGGTVVVLRMIPGMDAPVLTPIRLSTEGSLGAALASGSRPPRRVCPREGVGS